jgi:hypothetical protein
LTLRARQIELTDIDIQSGFVREKTWFTIYSPENRRYKISADHAPSLLAKDDGSKPQADGIRWVGLPETSYGGMYRQKGLELGKPSYSFTQDYSAASDMPIFVASNRVLESEATGYVNAKIIETNIKRAASGQLPGSTSITHHLNAPLDNWLIVYGTRVYYYDDVAAQRLKLPASDSAIKSGVALTLDSGLVKSRQLSTFLTGSIAYRVKTTSKIEREMAHRQTKYNPRSTDILPIIRMLTFHEESGGEQYTSLVNHALPEYELTQSLSLDRAIIVGTISTPTTELKINDSTLTPTSRESFVRIVIPVLEKEQLRSTLPKAP